MGVTDATAIQIATGIIAGGSLILVAIWIVNTVFGLLATRYNSKRQENSN
jgi:hypothetical protein